MLKGKDYIWGQGQVGVKCKSEYLTKFYNILFDFEWNERIKIESN